MASLRAHVLLALPVLFAGTALLLAGCAGSASPDAEGADGLAFTDVTDEAGLGAFRHETGARGDKWMPETMGSGAAFLDYDGDGWQDIVLVGGGYWGESPPEDYRALWLYRNQGDGTFELATEEAGLSGIRAYGFGVAAADIDNDGDTDLFLSTLGRNRLFENEGGTFREVTDGSGLGERTTWSSSALFFDGNGDGHLDLYVGNYVRWSPENDIRCENDAGEKTYCTPMLYEGVPGRYYENDGDGTFTDRSEEAGFLPAPGKTLGVAEIDFNRDRRPDLVVANDMDRNLLYVNEGVREGHGRFTERGMSSGIAFDRDGQARSGMGIDAGVVDSTGEVTLFVGNFSQETIGVFRHRGGGLFADRASASEIGAQSRLTLTFGLLLFDPNLDGRLDLFAANGHIRPSVDRRENPITFAQTPHLFLNDGDGTFSDRAGVDGPYFPTKIVARGAAYGDIDRDGDQDLLVTENGGGAYLWKNDTEVHEAIRVRLRGRTTNRDGLGAAVVAEVDHRRIYRRYHTGSSYLSQSELPVTIGLGEAEAADSVTVRWPSGTTDRLGPVEGGQSIRVVEGEGIVDRRPLETGSPPS